MPNLQMKITNQTLPSKKYNRRFKL